MNDSLRRRTFFRVWKDGAYKRLFANETFDQRARQLAPDDAPPIVAVAEGDSWFDYPLVLDFLDHVQAGGWINVWRESHFGHTLAQMHSSLQLDRTLEQVTRLKPDVFLLSCGGNDIMGASGLLRQVIVPSAQRRRPSDPYLDAARLEEVLRRSLLRQLGDFVKKVFAAADRAGLTDMPILIHGYDYAFPDGRSLVPPPLDALLPGPWLSPALHAGGYLKSVRPRVAEVEIAVAVVRELMDAWNLALDELEREWGGRVVHVNLLGSLPDRLKHWANETHPNEVGFRIVAQKLRNDVLALVRRG